MGLGFFPTRTSRKTEFAVFATKWSKPPGLSPAWTLLSGKEREGLTPLFAMTSPTATLRILKITPGNSHLSIKGKNHFSTSEKSLFQHNHVLAQRKVLINPRMYFSLIFQPWSIFFPLSGSCEHARAVQHTYKCSFAEGG